jgi:hypothetical protein
MAILATSATGVSISLACASNTPAVRTPLASSSSPRVRVPPAGEELAAGLWLAAGAAPAVVGAAVAGTEATEDLGTKNWKIKRLFSHLFFLQNNLTAYTLHESLLFRPAKKITLRKSIGENY